MLSEPYIPRYGAHATSVSPLSGVSYTHLRLADGWLMSSVAAGIETLTGYPPSDFINHAMRSYASVMHPDDFDAVNVLFAEALGRREPYAIEYRILDDFKQLNRSRV